MIGPCWNVAPYWNVVYWKTTGYLPIKAELRIYASLNYGIIGLENGLSPIHREAIIWTNTDLSSIWF